MSLQYGDFLFSSRGFFFFPRLISAVADWMSPIGYAYFLWRAADFNCINESLDSVNLYDLICCNPDPKALWSTF